MGRMQWVVLGLCIVVVRPKARVWFVQASDLVAAWLL